MVAHSMAGPVKKKNFDHEKHPRNESPPPPDGIKHPPKWCVVAGLPTTRLGIDGTGVVSGVAESFVAP